ncbi:hypothetical protein IFM89_029717 [Coptis chinensis]|uniref:Vacuolar protein sorting-associated protein 11 homolog n=1 Tax=Coptis chinensis TaxID=261450 RepID=A0A835H0N9_9MAGN|nr:hypothetical protein IFM89_029717 [Coptis chinensis]
MFLIPPASLAMESTIRFVQIPAPRMSLTIFYWQRNFLVTVGEDEQSSPQLSPLFLKVFDLDKMQSEGSSTTGPECIQILRIFTNQYPEAKITSFLVLEEAPPILLIAIGFDNGFVYCIKGDIARERIERFKLQVEDVSDNDHNKSVTGLGFRVDGQALQLFAVTPASVSLFSLQYQPHKRQTLDQIGSGVNSVTMSDRLELIVGRPEAVYFYEVDGRGPCWAFEGEKKFLGWFRGYLLCVIADQRIGKNTFNVYDLKNRLIAHSLVVKEVSYMLCEWGTVILIMSDKTALCIGEKDMESKLDMLFKKNLYTVAINLVQSQHADAAATAEVLRKYGDHLYGKQDYDEAMAQYIRTIGHLEPSYVIQKFLDAQRIYNLTNYLEKLHEKGLASKDHTTLLLNCYTKLKDVEKLDLFIKSEDGGGEHKFDVETAIRVCRAAGYHEHAMFVARKAGKHEWYLKILLEDLDRYEEALQYISGLEPSQAGVTMKEYGKILVDHRPVETIEILLRLCTEEEATTGVTFNVTYLSMLPSPVDFLNIFIHHPRSLMEFLEKYISKVKDSPAQLEIHNTLLELYLSYDLYFPSFSQENGGDVHRAINLNGVPVLSRAGSKERLIAEGENDAYKNKDCLERRERGLILLKNAWPSELENPLYDVDLAIILCEMNAFKEGLLFLYEKMKLYKEVISCYMLAHDHEGLIACCKRLGDSSKGGDPSLWGDLLKYFGELGEDCSNEVKEVLTYIERDDILPPIIVIQTLSKNPCLTLSVVKDYIARKLDQESKLIEEDRRSTDKYQQCGHHRPLHSGKWLPLSKSEAPTEDRNIESPETLQQEIQQVGKDKDNPEKEQVPSTPGGSKNWDDMEGVEDGEQRGCYEDILIRLIQDFAPVIVRIPEPMVDSSPISIGFLNLLVYTFRGQLLNKTGELKSKTSTVWFGVKVELQTLPDHHAWVITDGKNIQEETLAMKKEIQDLRTNARIFQLSKCTACTFTLDLPAVHFMCMHSFHLRCLGDNEKECPECAPEYRSVLEMKRSLEQNANDQDRFFQLVKSSKDGFSVIAEYFGKGIVSKTSDGQADTLVPGTSSTNGF